MITHSKQFGVYTSVLVPGGECETWQSCPDLPAILGNDHAHTCSDLSLILTSQGGVVASLLTNTPHGAFRLLARDCVGGALAGFVEWVRDPHGVWRQWDEPWTRCAHGQHQCGPVHAAVTRAA